MINISDFKPQVIPMQRPYPLVRFKCYTYAHIGSVVLLNPAKGIEVWPVVEGFNAALANSQILMSGHTTPEEIFLKLDVHEGDKISWRKFVDMVRNLWESKDFRLTVFWYDLVEWYKVAVRGMPKHIYLSICLNTLNAQDGGGVFFYMDSPDISLPENNLVFGSIEYEKMKSELWHYKNILPFALLHVLYDSDDAEEKTALERIKTDIEEFYNRMDDMDDGEDVDKAMCDLAHIAETLHENFIDEKELMGASKSHILDVICSKGGFDPKRKDRIWRVLVENNLVNAEKQDETGNSSTS